MRSTLLIVFVLFLGCTRDGDALNGMTEVNGWTVIYFGCGSTTHYLIFSKMEASSSGSSYIETGCRRSRDTHRDITGKVVMEVESRGNTLTINGRPFSLDHGRVFIARHSEKPASTTQYELDIPMTTVPLKEHIEKFVHSEEIQDILSK